MAHAHGIDSRVKKLQDANGKEAERLVKEVFPAKAEEMDKLLKTKQFEESRDVTVLISLSARNGDSGDAKASVEKKRKLQLESASGELSVSCNEHLVGLIALLKPELKEQVRYVSTLKLWIQFLIPKIEDGNNFGVSIQEEMLSEVRQVESDAASNLDSIDKYFFARAKLVSKLLKHRDIDDYQRAVQEHDENEYTSLRYTVEELRNSYACLHDILLKNFEKIKTPRNSNIGSIY